ncbi:hypothetical protein IID21_02585 [Patescibacteria group bacterium]|nr:hypothetical protein [Patescibacteria group bacterium]
MAKRRTKKQKQKANRQFSVYLKNEAENNQFEPTVKGQFKKRKIRKISKPAQAKNTEPTAKVEGLGIIKRDIVKSLILASLILGTELVIYFSWSR